MSWGYFLDLELTVARADWATLGKTTGGALPARWWGFQEAALEQYFGSTGFEQVTAKQVLARFTDGEGCVHTVLDAGDAVAVRLIAHLDRGGDTQVAGPIAALFDAAAKHGGAGRIRLVNDGTYAGEDGVEVAIVDGRLVRAKLEDARALAEELTAALYPELEEEIAKYVSPQQPVTEGARSKPATAKKPAKKAAKKPAAKKPVKKPAAKPVKKPAAKKPVKKPAPRRR